MGSLPIWHVPPAHEVQSEGPGPSQLKHVMSQGMHWPVASLQYWPRPHGGPVPHAPGVGGVGLGVGGPFATHCPDMSLV